MFIGLILLIKVFLIVEDILIFLESKSVDEFFFGVLLIEDAFEIFIRLGDCILAFLANILGYSGTLASKSLFLVLLIDLHLDNFSFPESELLGLVEGISLSSHFGQIFAGGRFDFLVFVDFLG